MIIILATLALLLLSSWYMWSRRKLPPGPAGIPVLGYLPWLDHKAPYVSLTQLAHKYGPIYGLHLGSVYTVVLSDVKLIRQALAMSSLSGRAPLYVTHGIMKGYGLICAEGNIWKDQRKFATSSLKNFGMVKFGPKREKMEQYLMFGVKECLEMLTTASNEGPFDPQDILRHCVGNVMNYIVFGKRYDYNDKMWIWLQHLQEEGTKYIGVAGPLNFLPFLRYIPMFKSSMNFLMDGKIKTHKIYEKIIEEYKNKLFNDNSADVHKDHFIHAFLEEHNKRKDDPTQAFYCQEQFNHLLADLFGAGLDTTLTTLRWFIYYITFETSVQKKLQQEINTIVGDRPVCLDDLPSLPFTEACIFETQRIRSVVPVGIPHGAVEETVLENYRVPKGAMIIPLQWAVHMDPRKWKNPELFNPERYLDSEGKLVKPETFIPFQTGKRMCLGDELARMFLFLFGASIVQHFDLKLPKDFTPDFEGDCGITLTPKAYTFEISPRK